MKWLFLLVFFISTIVQAQPSPTYLIGVAAENPPLSMQSDKENHFFGFEIDLMHEICNRLQINCEYKPVIVSKIASELLSGDIDLSIAAIIRPAAPVNGFIFSLPYLTSGAEFMTLKDSDINTPSDVINKTVGVRRGTLGGGHIFEDLVRQMYNNKIKIKEYLTTDALFMALTNKEVDILFTNEVVVRYWYYNNMELYKLIAPAVPVGEGYAVMTTTKYSDLITKINQVLLNMLSDGTYLRLYNMYFSWPSQATPSNNG